MQAAPTRYVSVSELYSTDEVELLLEEIRELEPTNCCAEDIQDFEIAGSATGGGGAGGTGAGGRSPAGTEHSWDSHAHYRRAPPPPPVALAPIYCRLRHLLTLNGSLTFLIILWCGGACACVWAGVGLRAWRVPLAARVRLLHLAALTSFFLHVLLLTLHVTQLVVLLPFRWRAVSAGAALYSSGMLCVGGALVLHAVLVAPEYRWAPANVAQPLLAAAGSALAGAALSTLAAVAAVIAAWASRRPMHAPPSATARSSTGSLRAAYRAVPQPSTSRDNPL
ncbi:hypothetical protein EVAR_61359_1 [Eumeta japonica]|uniref:MARVEL domain-containing protein n=1 Tax=Eumeta variegata TaxID=151549 RepID=A0A4C1ZN17_EUMVA|nr:hypothetical protein EVAR_61359_1 [Eumeta japonica]